MLTFGGCNNGVQAWGNGINNNETNNVGAGCRSQNFGQGSGSNHVSGGMWTVSPGFASPCAQGFTNPCARGVAGPCAYPRGGAPMNVGPGAGGWNGALLLEVSTISMDKPILDANPLVRSWSVFA
ncbi:hypothetical protein SLA2020_529160 [Shorea laevis]